MSKYFFVRFLIALIISITTIIGLAQEKSPKGKLPQYESAQNSGLGKIARLNKVDSQLVALTAEVQKLKAEVEQLKKQMAQRPTR